MQTKQQIAFPKEHVIHNVVLENDHLTVILNPEIPESSDGISWKYQLPHMYFTSVIDFMACKYTAVALSVICLYWLLLVDIFLSLAIVQSV